MDILLDSLRKSVEHLQIIDEVLSTQTFPERAEYDRIKQEIQNLNISDPDVVFTNLLYVGGKKAGKKGYQRQMILNDILEYVFFGREYYFMDGSVERKKIFLKILLYVINLLLIIDSLTVNVSLRNAVLNALESKLGTSFFKEDEMKTLHAALKSYDGPIGFPTRDDSLPDEINVLLNSLSGERDNRNRLNDYYDSLLPKTGGGLWNELIVYFYLLRRTSVYIIPLLLTQRIFSKDDMLKPPDYLVIDKQQKLFGIEVGGGKETQSGNFASKTGATMVTTQNTNVPPRCPICGKWLLFCPKVIDDCTQIEVNPLLRIKKEVRCVEECNLFSKDDIIAGKCPYTQYHGKVSDNTKNSSQQTIKFDSEYHYHYSCILAIQDLTAINKIKQQKVANRQTGITVLKTDYPYVSGIDVLEKLDRHEISCYGKYPNLDPENCKKCDYLADCQKLTKTTDMLNSVPLSDEQKNKLKEIW
ncbi:hypothetical protein Nlim_1298 [Candidatus Nitrosarchaeum limnium SFB1]|uniref:Uncharacterized protein n=1 Tax=Candidatus Nitrosarchaeum limnium SFB1 TaxID=886738 RepID=F3KLB9_9ARCH|nr:hypothetical protein Nlim_1298 [Candidatus Nitrosarchaeum limnium SFB1]